MELKAQTLRGEKSPNGVARWSPLKTLAMAKLRFARDWKQSLSLFSSLSYQGIPWCLSSPNLIAGEHSVDPWMDAVFIDK
jgi:hypothetical protein